MTTRTKHVPMTLTALWRLGATPAQIIRVWAYRHSHQALKGA